MKTIVALFVLFAATVMAEETDFQVPPDAPVISEQSIKRPPTSSRLHRVRRQATVACPQQSTLTAAQQTESLNIHNSLRALENSANQLQMTYSADLANQAQGWANQCQWMHGGLTGCGAYTGQTSGQNLYVENLSTGFPPVNMTKVCVSWNNERNFWNFATGTCATGQICGHWSQLEWARSSKVGCAYKQCSNMNVAGSIWQNALYVVCDYMGPGNVAGQPIMLPGPSCSNCDSDGTGQGYKCVGNLCQACAGPGSDSACKCGTVQSCQNGGTWNKNTCQCTCPKGWYGLNCQNSCNCADLDPDDCPFWASPAGGALCTDSTYGPWMGTQCMTSCNVPCLVPAGTTTC